MPTYNIAQQGADKTGEVAIDTVLSRLIGSDTTIVFPRGTYKINELVVQSGTNNLELIAPRGARLVPGRSDDSIRWIDVYSNGFVLDGFELDMRNIEIPPFVRMNSEAGNWEIRRVITRGRVRGATDTNVGSNSSSEARTYFRLSAAAGTRGLLQDCYFNRGSCAPDEASNRRAILVESAKGALTFNRCWFESWGENTIYAKKPEGRLKILNCFVRNSQNGLRLGGNTDVQNCVSIKDDQHPTQAWSNGSLQRGVNAEAIDSPNTSQGINSYDGTLSISDSDFYHRYPDNSCGGAITAPAPCQRINIQRVRISYNSTKSHDAIYTYEGRMSDGTPANLEYLQLEDVHVTNDHRSEYGIYIGQVPDTWGTVSGVIGGSGTQTNSSYVQNQMTTGEDPIQPNTTPPLPSPPPLGEVPMQQSQLVRIDNTGGNEPTTYQITAGQYALPAANDGASITMSWGPDSGPRRPPNSEVATGTIPAGKAHAFYVRGGIISTESNGPAVWTVDGEAYEPESEGPAILTNRITSEKQEARSQWQLADTVVQPNGVAIAKPLSYDGIQPAHVRVRNIADSSLEYRLEEWRYLDGNHTNETFHTLSTRVGEHEIELDNGTTYRTKGRKVATNDEFKSVSLGDFFGAETPILLAQAQSFNGGDPIVTRLRNISSDAFDVRVQEEEAQGGHPNNEQVGTVALEQTVGSLDSRSFEVQRTGETVNHEWSRIAFEQAYEIPQFVADIQTFNGSDTANLRYRNLSGSGVEIKVEEAQSADTEIEHAPESVGYAVFEGATLLTTTVTSNQATRGEWKQADSIVQPNGVVIASPLSYNGPSPCHVRLRNVGGNSFGYKLEEWKYLDGRHISETFHALAAGVGSRQIRLDDGRSSQVEVGTVSTPDRFISVSLSNSFGAETPVVLAQSQTFNGGDPIVTRIQNVSNNSFDVRVQEEEAESGHPNNETVGYIALEEVVGEMNGRTFEVQRTGATISNRWSRINFQQSYEDPKFVASIQTFNGADTANLRYRNLTGTSVEVKVEEGESADTETEHVSEAVGYAVFEDSV
ncbi:hypothetical protein [Haladaptatus caseinilyticus]|uniref:hypothetical protein n=1 Tax=Haladaptatus caseinilyticus TaxID=2993314 RepID=UPI00224B785D|nr:hypothetical protein [Haladaptatus caseinilyticus]